MKYVVYTLADGRILRFGDCMDVDFDNLGGDGTGVLEAEADALSYVDLTTQTVVSMGPKPRPDAVFDFQTHQWVADSSIADSLARSRRLQMLEDSDWTDTASAPSRLGQAVYDQWQTYRQALRDITDQPGYPLSISWPTPP